MTVDIFHQVPKIVATLLLGYVFLVSGAANAEVKAPEKGESIDVFSSVLESRVARYKKNLAKLAGEPMIISAVKEANQLDYAGHMSNSEWSALAHDDPKVLKLNKNETGELLAKFEKSRAFEKLNVRDAKGYLVVFSSDNIKPLVYNAAERPGFVNGLKGVWSDSEIKPDPTTKKKAVQIAAPIMDGGKVIGVIHSSVSAE